MNRTTLFQSSRLAEVNNARIDNESVDPLRVTGLQRVGGKTAKRNLCPSVRQHPHASVCIVLELSMIK